MTILPFPLQPHAAITVKRDEVEALARLLGGVVIWPDDPRLSLTPREESVLALMSDRTVRTALSISVQLGIEHSWACAVCRRLVAKGYALRAKGGWKRIGVDNINSTPLTRVA